MSFISLAVSVFITNYIFIIIIRLLPIRRKKWWQGITISVADLGSLIFYLWLMINGLSQGFDVAYFFIQLGNILGHLIAYVAAMMIILDGVTIFKSKRYREFERGINKKDGRSVPRNVFASICIALSILLIIFSVSTILNYSTQLLFTLIGTIAGALILLGVGIYFYLSGKPIHSSIKGSNLLFVIQTPTQRVVFASELSKEVTEDSLLGEIKSIYILDEYGVISTPTKKLVVKGIKVNSISQDTLNKVKMNLLNPNPYDEAMNHFQKYNRKKIVLDEKNEVIKISDLK